MITKLNLGCGRRQLKGFVNIDNNSIVKPDLIVNLGLDKLPFKDNVVDYVYSKHFFEHLTSDELMFLIDELYRVCKCGARLKVVVPHMKNPVMGQIQHKHGFSENSFDNFNYVGFDPVLNSGYGRSYFRIGYTMSFMRYRPKRSGVLRLLPFLGIVPCNIVFDLEVVKN